MSFDRHSFFADLTQRSAYEFKFGLLAGKRIGFTFPDSISSRNAARLTKVGTDALGKLEMKFLDKFESLDHYAQTS